MQLYEGEKPKNIVNGNIDTEEKWKRLNEIKDTYIQTLFGNKIIGPYISKELIKFMYKDIFNSEHKITVIVGHDSNIAALFSALNIKKYTLEKQYEMFPVGGFSNMERQGIEKKEGKNRVYISINRTAEKSGTVKFKKFSDENSIGNGRMSC